MIIKSYNNFILEKEYNNILYLLLKVVENETYRDVKSPIIEWDLSDRIQPTTMEWDFEKRNKFDKLVNDIKNAKTKFLNWIQDPEVDNIHIDYNHPLLDAIKDFLKKLKNKEEIKAYFYRLLEDLKSLPYNVKKNLLIKLTFVFLLYIPINDLISNDDIKKTPVLNDVKTEIVASSKPINKDVKKSYSKFEIAHNSVAKIEGGYTDNRNDKGNWTGNEIGSGRLLGTKYGIAAPTLVNYYKNNNLGTPSKADMENLSHKTALNIYKKDYWDAQKLSNFKNQSIANILYDGCVNQGPSATLTILKKSLNDVDINSNEVETWNDFHNELIYDVNDLSNRDSEELFDIIKDYRLERYKKGRVDFIDGWTNRLDDLSYNNPDKENNTDIS